MREGEVISPSRAMKIGVARENSSRDGNYFHSERDNTQMCSREREKKGEESSSHKGIISVARRIVERGGEKEECRGERKREIDRERKLKERESARERWRRGERASPCSSLHCEREREKEERHSPLFPILLALEFFSVVRERFLEEERRRRKRRRGETKREMETRTQKGRERVSL